MNVLMAEVGILGLIVRVLRRASAYFQFKRASSARAHPAEDAKGSGLYGVLVSRHYL